MVTPALLEAIARQEEALVFDAWDEDRSWRVGRLIRDWGAAGSWPIVIDIGLFNRPMFFAAMAGSVPDYLDWVRRKRNVVERYHKSSYRVGREFEAKGDAIALHEELAPRDYADHGGGFPIRLRGTGVVGAVVVSGLVQREDHMVIVRALCSELDMDGSTLALPDE